ncbi:hypothetical protein T4E_1723, partial [Trichinella pseudospiralis]
LLLPKFDGRNLLFKFFLDQFEATIHRHKDLTDITKLIHIKSCFSGPVMKVVKGGLTICSANYLEVVQMVKNKFHRLLDGVEPCYWEDNLIHSEAFLSRLLEQARINDCHRSQSCR